ncbi:MAG: acetate--CoA ligase family protein, partial [Actinomycetota bacterium]
MISLSEFASKRLLNEYGLPITNEFLAKDAEEAVKAASSLGYPVVAKLCGETIQHKTELNGVRLNLQNRTELEVAIAELEDISVDNHEFLIAEQIHGKREFIAGYHIDADFGPVLMFGLGG